MKEELGNDFEYLHMLLLGSLGDCCTLVEDRREIDDQCDHN